MSVIDRYLLGAAALMVVFCAVALGGWTMLEPGWAAPRLGARRRRAGRVRVAIGRQHVQPLEPAHHARRARGLPPRPRGGPAQPGGQAELQRCPLLSLPDNKLIPDARWILAASASTTSSPAARPAATPNAATTRSNGGSDAGSVAVYPLGGAVFFEAIVDLGDDPLVQVPPRDSGASTRAATTPFMRTAEPGRPARRHGPPAAARAADGRRGGHRARRGRLRPGRARPRARGRSRRCACGASRRGCRTSTTPTRTPLRAQGDRMFARHAEPALLREPARFHLSAAPACSASAYGGGDGVVSALSVRDPSRRLRARAGRRGACSGRSPSGCST